MTLNRQLWFFYAKEHLSSKVLGYIRVPTSRSSIESNDKLVFTCSCTRFFALPFNSIHVILWAKLM